MPEDTSRTDAAKERLSNRGRRDGKGRSKPKNAPTVGDVLNAMPPPGDQDPDKPRRDYHKLTQQAVDRAEAELGKRITSAERSMLAAKIAVKLVHGQEGFDPIAELALIGANTKLPSETRVKALTAVAKHTVPTLKSVELTVPDEEKRDSGEDPRAIIARAIGLTLDEEGNLIDEDGEIIEMEDDE